MSAIINLTADEYSAIRNIYYKGTKEQAAYIQAKKTGDIIYPASLTIYEKDMLELQTTDAVNVNPKYLTASIYLTKRNGNNIFISLHTHPNCTTTQMSQADESFLSKLHAAVKDLNIDLMIIEAVISRTGLDFYYWNDEKQAVELMPYTVDGIVQKPSTEFGIFKSFKKGFNEGKRLYTSTKR